MRYCDTYRKIFVTPPRIEFVSSEITVSICPFFHIHDWKQQRSKKYSSPFDIISNLALNNILKTCTKLNIDGMCMHK